MIIKGKSTYETKLDPKYALLPRNKEVVYGDKESAAKLQEKFQEFISENSIEDKRIMGSTTINYSTRKEGVQNPVDVNMSTKQGTVYRGFVTNVGGNTIKVTDPFGIRNFAGRKGQHSTGIDIITSNKHAIALTDGVIESVSLQGDGSKIKPTEGKAAGYYVTIKNSDGTRSQYMHLDPIGEEDKNKLIGKKVKRGDNIWGYSIGSGSMTGEHVKVRFYTGSNPLNSYIDPTNYLLNLK